MAAIVGYRFKPTNKEIIGHFLQLKLQGMGFLVDNFIPEINICSHEPWELPGYARITSGDNTWYFFYLPEKISDTNSRVKRTTKTGFWKTTGKDREIKDEDGNLIGIIKTVAFHENPSSKGFNASWVIHEYHHHLTFNQSGYILCKLIYKGNDKIDEPSFGSTSASTLQAEGNEVDMAQYDKFMDSERVMAYYDN